MLKQKGFEIYRETDALLPKAPTLTWQEQGRQVELREVKNLTFTEVCGEVRVVVSDELAAYGPRVIHTVGHGRWGIENQGFNVLTQHYHFTHCAHYHPQEILARCTLSHPGICPFRRLCPYPRQAAGVESVDL